MDYGLSTNPYAHHGVGVYAQGGGNGAPGFSLDAAEGTTGLDAHWTDSFVRANFWEYLPY